MTTWLLLFAVHSFLILVNTNISSRIIQVVPINFPLLYGPLLWLYVKDIMGKNKRVDNQKLLHFFPFVIFIFLSIIFYKSGIFLKTLALSGVASGIIYCILTYKQLEKHKEHIVNHFSNIEKINLNWIKQLLWGLTVIWIGVFVVVFISRFLNVQLPMNWFFLFIPLFISYLGYYGLKQQIIDIEPKVESSKSKIVTSQKQQTYKKSGLQESDMLSIFDKLEQLMQTQQLYLQSTLSLKELSEKSKIPQHHITQTLNDYASVNFYDYINAYRVATFKQKIQQGDAKNFSLLGIAFDCGFNSKSSFNRIFKNSTGKSPSEYKKSISQTAD